MNSLSSACPAYTDEDVYRLASQLVSLDMLGTSQQQHQDQQQHYQQQYQQQQQQLLQQQQLTKRLPGHGFGSSDLPPLPPEQNVISRLQGSNSAVGSHRKPYLSSMPLPLDLETPQQFLSTGFASDFNPSDIFSSMGVNNGLSNLSNGFDLPLESLQAGSVSNGSYREAISNGSYREAIPDTSTFNLQDESLNFCLSSSPFSESYFSTGNTGNPTPLASNHINLNSKSPYHGTSHICPTQWDERVPNVQESHWKKSSAECDMKLHCDHCYKRVYSLAETLSANVSVPCDDGSALALDYCSDVSAAVYGLGIRKAVRGRTSSFKIYFSGKSIAACNSIANSLQVLIEDPKGSPCALKIKRLSPEMFAVRYKPDFEGEYTASVRLNSTDIEGFPCTIHVGTQHKYELQTQVKATIESDPTNPNSLREPWGICCNSEGFIFIGDRKNHMVRVYRPNLAYSHSIGSHGTDPGKLNKPAGVATNSRDEIIVADKDNHRIQVFDIRGKVILVFGEQGTNSWQLNYPWDVAVTPQDAILVSDSRNGRVSLFSSDGSFLRDFGLEDRLLKCPRGICYREYDDKIITADMNKHQIVVIDAFDDSSSDPTCSPGALKAKHPTFIGRKGSDPDELCRPQGVACDQEGNVIVSDSRNSRLQVFDSDGNYLNHWSVEGPDPSRQSQPMGVAVSPAGNILVIDGEHSRVLVY